MSKTFDNPKVNRPIVPQALDPFRPTVLIYLNLIYTAPLGQSGQIVVKLMRVKVSNDRILIGLFGTAFDDSIGS